MVTLKIAKARLTLNQDDGTSDGFSKHASHVISCQERLVTIDSDLLRRPDNDLACFSIRRAVLLDHTSTYRSTRLPESCIVEVELRKGAQRRVEVVNQLDSVVRTTIKVPSSVFDIRLPAQKSHFPQDFHFEETCGKTRLADLGGLAARTWLQR